MFFAAAFLVLVVGRWISPVDNVVVTVTAPFAAVINGVANSIGDTLSGVMNAGQLQQQNASLKKENGQLLHRLVIEQSQMHDYAILKAMLHFDDGNIHMDFLPANVIWSDPTGLGSYLYIDKGSRDGLSTGMTVVDQNGYFVGSIVKVYTSAARVLLMLSPSSSVAVIDTRTQASGLVEGRYATGPQLRYVLTGEKLRKNDLIVTSGQANLYPRNLLVGQVINVQRSPQNVFQTADIRPAADFAHLEILQVIRNWRPSFPAQLVPQR